MNSEELHKEVSFGPPLRLMGIGWVCLLIIYFLPLVWWGILLKVLAAISLFAVIKASWHPIWNSYVTMGAFVVMQTVWFAGILWTPGSFVFMKYIFGFLIVLGILTKYKQIKHIKKGLSPDLQQRNSS